MQSAAFPPARSLAPLLRAEKSLGKRKKRMIVENQKEPTGFPHAFLWETLFRWENREITVNLSTFSTGQCGKTEEIGVDMLVEMREKTSKTASMRAKRVESGGIMSFFGR